MPATSSFVQFLIEKIWHLLEWVLEEFAPWLKWLVFDAVLRMVVRYLIDKSERLRHILEKVGLADY